MLGLITALLPFIVSIVGYFLERAGASIATKNAFIKLIENMSKDNLSSVRLHKSYVEQKRRLEEGLEPLAKL